MASPKAHSAVASCSAGSLTGIYCATVAGIVALCAGDETLSAGSNSARQGGEEVTAAGGVTGYEDAAGVRSGTS